MKQKAESTKAKKRAAAISFDPEVDSVPVMTAFGEGYVAENIIQKGIEAGIPVIPDPNLASMLAKMSIGDEIPPSLYEVVAKILVFVGDVDRSYGEKIKRSQRT